MSKGYDLVILGGGTGGYAAAIRASQLGLQVAIVEQEKLGGTCLHRGCIPSKALLRSAEVYRQTKEAEVYGVSTSNTELNFIQVQKRKNKIVEQLHQGVQGLMKKGKIDVIHGYGRILGPSIFSPMPGTISIEHNDGRENTMIVPKNVIIATGSRPKSLPGLNIDGTQVMSSEEALQMEELPSSITIIGGGIIGIEWASMLADFGVEVTVVEQAEQILPTEDHAVAKEIEKRLAAKGVTFKKAAKALPETVQKDRLISIDVEIDGETETFTAEQMLISVGREANTDHIGLQNTEIVNENGFIQANEYYQTAESHIYAIGDVIGGMQLAHVASYEGMTAVEHMADQNPLLIDYNHIPSCIYCHPEAASVGLTENRAKEKGYEVDIGSFPFQANGKALVYGETEGFVKIISDKNTKDLLGVHMVGPQVTDMISEVGLAQVLDATPWDIAQSIHPHPTLSEVIGEAALAVEGKQIHG